MSAAGRAAISSFSVPHARHRRRHAHRVRRWSAGSASWLLRLQRAAYGGHVCQQWTVKL